tara:strand:+ start:1482 stop:1808 length:327 start_codon:yes stop_codon:yes gene_type:complete
MLPDDLEELLEDLTEPLEDLELLVDLIVPDEDLELLADLTVPEDLLVLLGLVILVLDLVDGFLIVLFREDRTAELDLPTLDPVALRDNLLEGLFRLDKADVLLLALFK